MRLKCFYSWQKPEPNGRTTWQMKARSSDYREGGGGLLPHKVARLHVRLSSD